MYIRADIVIGLGLYNCKCPSNQIEFKGLIGL